MSFWYKCTEICQYSNCSCQVERQGPWTSCFILYGNQRITIKWMILKRNCPFQRHLRQVAKSRGYSWRGENYLWTRNPASRHRSNSNARPPHWPSTLPIMFPQINICLTLYINCSLYTDQKHLKVYGLLLNVKVWFKFRFTHLVLYTHVLIHCIVFTNIWFEVKVFACKWV